jgi:hypothetical protein
MLATSGWSEGLGDQSREAQHETSALFFVERVAYGHAARLGRGFEQTQLLHDCPPRQAVGQYWQLAGVAAKR